jgi:hypothetical protein
MKVTVILIVELLSKGLDKESLVKLFHLHHGCKHFALFSLHIYMCVCVCGLFPSNLYMFHEFVLFDRSISKLIMVGIGSMFCRCCSFNCRTF